MKLRTFLALAGGGAVVVVGSLVLLGRSLVGPARVDPPGPAAEASPTLPVAPVVAPAVVAAEASAEADVLVHLGRDLGAEKVKDATPGKPWKVNLYQDAGATSVNRAKLDLDRDDKWDQKWTFEADRVALARAPADDEDYREAYLLVAGTWNVVAGDPAFAASLPLPAGGPLAAASPAAPLGQAPTAAHQDALGWAGKDLGADKVKDATGGAPWKVNLYQDPGHGTVSRAKLDLDRDDRWDEKWTFDGSVVTREVSPADDEVYTETWRWTGSGWVPAT